MLIKTEIKKTEKEDFKSIYSLISVLKENLDYTKFKQSFDNNICKDGFSIIYYWKIIIQLDLLV